MVKPRHGDGQEVRLDIAVGRSQKTHTIEGDDTDCAFLRSKNTFTSKSGSACFQYCLEAETEPLLDEVRPLSQPTLAWVEHSETV